MTVVEEPDGRPGRLLGGMLSLGAGSAVALVALFAESVIAVRTLELAEVGAFALVTVLVMLAVTLADIGLTAGVTHWVASGEPSQRARFVAAGLLLRTPILGILTIVVVFGGTVIRSLIGPGFENLELYVIAMMWGASLDDLATGALRGYELHRWAATLSVVRGVVRLVVSAVLLLLADWGPEALAVSWSAAYAITTIAALTHVPGGLRAPNLRIVRDLVGFGRRAVGPRLMSYMSTYVPVGVLGVLGTNEMVGIFTVAQRLPAGVRTIADAATAVFYPRMSALVSAGERARAIELLTNMSLLILTGFGGVAVVVAVSGSDILALVFGGGFAEGGLAFTLLLLALALNLPNWFMGYSLAASDRPGTATAITVAEVLALLVAEALLVGSLTYNAPALAMVVSTAAGLPLGVVLLRRVDLSYPWREQLKQAALLMVFVGLGYAVVRPLGGPLPVLVAGGLLLAGVYGLASYWLTIRHLPVGARFVEEVLARGRRLGVSSNR